MGGGVRRGPVRRARRRTALTNAVPLAAIGIG